jgi:hypothetical protein
MSNSPDPRTLKICEKELKKLEKGKKKNGGRRLPISSSRWDVTVS